MRSPALLVVLAAAALGCGSEAPAASYPVGRSVAYSTEPDPHAYAIVSAPFEPGPIASNEARAPIDLRSQADQPTQTTGLVLDAGKLGHDPQIAVGDRFIILYEAHGYRLLDKATGQVLAQEAGDEIAPQGSFADLFAPLWVPRDKRGAPNRNNLNLLLGFNPAAPMPCDPENPRASASCVQEFYDTRIVWDALRKRFWVESAARNHLWLCEGMQGNTGDGGHGEADEDDDEIGGDGCNDGRHSDQARRFVAIAVSVSDDPRKGWHRYALTDEYTDWPKISLHDHYLLVGYRAGHNVYVFDADKLAAGNPGGAPVRIARIDARRLGASVTVLTAAAHHGPSDGFTYLVGTDGSGTVTPVALYNPDPNRAAQPYLVRGASVQVGARFKSFDDSPVYRDGQLYLAQDECVEGVPRCGIRDIAAVRLPVHGEGGTSPRIFATTSPSAGFLSFLLQGREPYEPPSDWSTYEKPAFDVNGHGDMVMVFARRGYRTAAPLPSEVRYTILYHGERAPRPSVLLKRGTDADLPDVDDNRKAGIDLAYAQTDPTDDWTVWVTHAYADASVHWYRQVAAAIRP